MEQTVVRVRRRRIWVIQQQKGELAERQRRAGVWSKAFSQWSFLLPLVCPALFFRCCWIVVALMLSPDHERNAHHEVRMEN